METTTINGNAKVPFGQKLAFGLGMLANQMFPAILGIFMVVLIQNLGFPGWMLGIIYFLPRVFDALTDPIMGFISDNTKSVWGRRRQYVFIGAIITGLSFVLMWQLYKENSIEYNFIYFLLWSFVFYLGITIFSVPYVAMGYEMSNDFHERTSIMAVSQWIGQWAWVIAPWFWVIMYDASWFPTAEAATRELALWVGIACTLCAIVPAIFIPGESTLNEKNYSPLTFGTIGSSLKEILMGFKEAFQSPPFRKLCFATFFIFNAFNTVAGFTFFIVVHHLFRGNAQEAGIWIPLFGSLGALVTTFVVIPIVARMSKTMGKKNAFLLSQSISIIGYILLWFLFIPGKPYMFIFALPFFSFGIGSLFTLMMSMTSDVIDLDELNTGKRREGVFGAIYWWMVKFGLAIAGALSGIILDGIGFNAAVSPQPEATLIGLRAFYSGVPIVGTLIAIVVMWNYDLDEARAHEISAELEKRKTKPKPVSSSSSYAKLGLLANNNLAFDSTLKIDFANKSEEEIQAIFAKSLNDQIHGLCFSPYLDNQNIGDILSEQQIRQRMQIIQPYTQWVRSFSCIEGNEFIPKVAKEFGLKTIAGAWIGSDRKINEQEINNLIELAKAGQVDIAAVGNEVLLRGELSKDELIAYIKQVKKALPGIPVGCVDTYYQFSEHPELVEVCDVILANCYPFWEGYDIGEAPIYLQKMYAFVEKVSKDKKIIVTETGWPSQGEPNNQAIPSKSNVMKYFIDLNNWSKKKNIEVFYFSSFDEAWKVRHEGNVGQSWGIWDKHEKLKYTEEKTIIS
jgi:glycoside/pentoside/hexuronide:cation symporter, GPH family